MKQLAAFFLIFLFINQLSAQETGLITPIPPSPDAQSLFKFSTLPVSKYTGIPSISIPLYTIKCKRTSIPIQLDYHAGGIRVTEVPSSVGMGWALECGGLLTQTVRGLDDYSVNYGRVIKPVEVDNPDACDVKDVIEGKSDPEPDIFSYMVLGKSGSFALNAAGQPIQMEEKKFKIESYFNPGSIAVNSMAWKITDTKGIQYFFESYEQISSQITNVVSGNTNFNNKTTSLSSKTWYLNRIIDLPGDTVSFVYDSTTTLDYIYSNETKNFTPATPIDLGNGLGNCGPESVIQSDFYQLNTNYVKQIIVKRRLKTVIFPGGRVEFIQGGTRCDLSGDSYLGKVRLYSSNNSLVKEYNLRFKYLVGNQLLDPTSVDCSSDVPFINTPGNSLQNNFVKRRLVLVGLDEMDINGNKIDSYNLDYESSIGLPDRFSAQQDLWGYYNGNNYTSLLQNLTPTGDSINRYPLYTTSGKNPNLTYARQGILNKITYPTGGYSSFNYELNVQSVASPNSTTHTFPDFTVAAANAGSGQILTNFTVNDISGAKNITFELDTCAYGASFSRGGFSIINSLNSSVVLSETAVASAFSIYGKTMTFHLPNGSYTLQAAVNNRPCSYVIKMHTWTDQQPGYTMINQAYGGLRIKTISNYDPVTGSLTDENYQYTLPNGLSSMVMFNLPIDYGNYQMRGIGQSGGEGGQFLTFCAYEYMQVNSSTHYPLATAQNGGFGYSYVTVKEADGVTNIDNGYSIFQSDTAKKDLTGGTRQPYAGALYPNFSGFGDGFPWVTGSDLSWARGKPTLEEHYKRKADGTYVCIQRKKYFYSYVPTNGINAYAAGYIMKVASPNPANTPCPVTGLIIADHDMFARTGYQLAAGYQVMDSSINETIDDAGNILRESTFFQYNINNLQPSTVKKTNSKNEFQISTLKYPLDYLISGTPVSPSIQGIKNLQTTNDIDEITEAYNQRQNIDGTNLRTTSATLLTFKPSLFYRDSVYTTENSGVFTNFIPASITASGIVKDSHYQPRVIFDSYDAIGNILQEHKISDINKSYVWDYSHVYPIAEISNGAQTDIAYTSFEAEGTGNWIIGAGTLSTSGGMTGNNYYTLSPGSVISKTGLNATKNYLVTYWSKNGPLTISGTTATAGLTKRNWIFYQHTLLAGSISVSISGTGIGLDELRLYPTDAQMSTFTYAPLIGQSSACSANSTITYYEYDGLGRLLRIRDMDSNIDKQYDYQYQVLATTQPIWQSNGQLRCKPCPASGSYITNMQQHQEIDINTQSATYNSNRWVDDGIPGSCTAPADWQNTVTAVRCKQVSSMNTGELEQEQWDLNPCSATYNQIRWVVTVINLTACPVPPTWQSNGQLRCKPCPANSSYTTNIQQHQETDVNPGSPTYNTTRWVDDGIPGSCVISPDWQNTTTAVRCQQSGGANDGYQEQEQKDMNPCSSTYNTTRWTTTVLNATACPYCNSTNCGAANQKCFGATCQIGTHGIVSQTFNGSLCTTQYGWFFSDGTYHLAEKVVGSGQCR